MALVQLSSATLGSWPSGHDTLALPLKRPATPATPSCVPQKKFRCDPCDQGFTTNRALRRHRRESQRHQADFDQELFKCSECTLTFSRAFDRERHWKEQHADGKVDCIACGKRMRANSPHKCLGETVARPIVDECSRPQDADLPTPTPLKVDNRPCEGKCFLTAGSEGNSDGQERRGIRGTVSKDQVRNPEARRRIACGICHEDFELHDPDALFAHLNRHFESLDTSQHKCDICQITFVHASDLERHLSSAAKGDCGFSFVHRVPCTGHHAPGTSGRKMGTQCQDDDRFSFSYRLSHWEHAQLLGFIKSIERMTRSRPRPTTISAPMVPWYSARKVAQVTEGCDCEGCRVHKFYLSQVSRSGSYCKDHDHQRSPESVVRPLVCALTQGLRSMQDSKPENSTCVGKTTLRRRRSFTEGMLSLSLNECKCSQTAIDYQSLERDLRALLSEHPVDLAMYCRKWDGALLRAAASGDLDLMHAAISHGADVNCEDGNGMRALHYAIIVGSLEAVQLLFDNLADPGDGSYRTPLLVLAAENRHCHLIELLLARTRQPAESVDRAAVKACRMNDIGSLELLFSNGASLKREAPHDRHDNIITAINAKTLRWLLDNQLCTDGLKDRFLLAACRSNRKSLVEQLLRRGAKIRNIQDQLRLASTLGRKEFLSLLLLCCREMSEAEISTALDGEPLRTDPKERLAAWMKDRCIDDTLLQSANSS